MPTQGIYKITNTSSGRVYIGQSCCIENRLAAHRRYLVRGIHDNQRLQRAWNKHGGDSFSFEVLEVVNDSNHLTSREQFWIDALDAAGSGGYNMCPAAGSCKGYKHTQESIARRKGKVPWNKGMRKQYKLRPATQDRKSKIGNAQKGEKNHNFGKQTPPEVKDKIRSALAGEKCYLAKLDDQKVREIKIALLHGAVGAELARKYGVANTQISAIKHGKTWRHVTLSDNDNVGAGVYDDCFAGTSVSVAMMRVAHG